MINRFDLLQKVLKYLISIMHDEAMEKKEKWLKLGIHEMPTDFFFLSTVDSTVRLKAKKFTVALPRVKKMLNPSQLVFHYTENLHIIICKKLIY